MINNILRFKNSQENQELTGRCWIKCNNCGAQTQDVFYLKNQIIKLICSECKNKKVSPLKDFEDSNNGTEQK